MVAPFSVNHSLEARGFQVLSSDQRSVLVEAGFHAPLRWFLDQTKPVAEASRPQASASHKAAARPFKRQKVRHVDLDDDSEEIAKRPGQRIHLAQADLEISLWQHATTINGKPKDLVSTDYLHTSAPAGSDEMYPATQRAGLPRETLTVEQHQIKLLSVSEADDEVEFQFVRTWPESPVLVMQTSNVTPVELTQLQAFVAPRSDRGIYHGDPVSRFWSSLISCAARVSSNSNGLLGLELSLEVSCLDGVRADTDTDIDILGRFYGDIAPLKVAQQVAWNPRDFYESVYVPPKTTPAKLRSALHTQLYPFQERTVQWMLSREGASVRNDGPVITGGRPRSSFSTSHIVAEASGTSVYCDSLTGALSYQKPDDAPVCFGGILAEEMGLGKTVELVALITAHPRPDRTPSRSGLSASKATLIISPGTILQQWKSELAMHAPNLKVYHYEGMIASSKARKDGHSHTKLIDIMTEEYDIVLTTFRTLTSELHFAVEPPKRNMRRERKYERAKCPLVEIDWWRICLDEAQMLETGVSAAAQVACQLPRVNSWAVSGTPVKRNVEDLHGLMVFLRLEPFASQPGVWRRMLARQPNTARELFNTIALRHTKAQVREDIQLPPQKRVVLSMPFTIVENQQYLNMYNQMCEAVGVNPDGSPASEDWDPEDSGTITSMRAWLGRLRKTCLHPQVHGMLRGRRLGKNAGPLRTVDEVLDAMIEQNESLRRTEERTAVQAQLTSGHVLGNNKSNDKRSIAALEVYQTASTHSQALVEEARKRLQVAQAAYEQQKKDKASSDSEEDEADSTLGRFRTAVRTALQLLHTCTYFAASATYQIKVDESLTKPESDDFKRLEDGEGVLYDQAKAIRREILLDTQRKTDEAIGQIKKLVDQKKLTSTPAIDDIGRLGGLAARNIIEKSYDLFDTIREISKTLEKWRAKMVELLTTQLVDAEKDDNELKGDEYEQSTKQQDELYVYFDAFKALHADLIRCISGDSAPLIDNEIRGALKAAKRWLDPTVLIDMKSLVHAPELAVELFEYRQRIRAKLEQLDSIRGLIAEARRLQDPAFNKNTAEAGLGSAIVNHLQPILTKYNKAIASFEKEVDLFRNTQNSRLDYYRQLQAISDDVAPYKEELDENLDGPALDNALAEHEYHSGQAAQLRTKHRFLTHLKDESSKEESARICVICQMSFENGVLTICGHQYCKECIQQWWRAHRSCPVCKRGLNLNDFHNITYVKQDIKMHEEEQPGQSSPGSGSATASERSSRAASIYSEVDAQLMNQIRSYDLPRAYGTKIDTLARHLLWIREHDPGAKSIVFSQYRDFLDVLGNAFQEFKIGFERIGNAGAVERFRQQAGKDCLLMDAKTDSSGLTLVNATHVFICEPLVQTAVELQAIARVHRIGQTRQTTVWMYLVNDTVEESIYAISKARRLAQMQAKLTADSTAASGASTPLLGDQAIDKANSEELQRVKLSNLLESGKAAGELVGKDDLWQCLFGNAQKVVDATRPQLQAEVDRNLRAHAAELRAEEQ